MADEVYKYLTFRIKEQRLKTNVYSCLNNNSRVELGVVKWYGAWRQYCYFPLVEAVYNQACLNDIATFLEKVNKEHKGS